MQRLQDLSFLQWCCQRFKLSWVWHCRKVSGSWTAWPLEIRHHNPSKHQHPLPKLQYHIPEDMNHDVRSHRIWCLVLQIQERWLQVGNVTMCLSFFYNLRSMFGTHTEEYKLFYSSSCFVLWSQVEMNNLQANVMACHYHSKYILSIVKLNNVFSFSHRRSL
jgi:hypothetical protein